MPVRFGYGTLTMGTVVATSGTMTLGGATSGHIVMPDSFTGTVLTFNTSADGQTYRPLTNANGAVTPAASMAGSKSYPLPSELFSAHSFFLTAGTIQAAARSFIIALKGGS